MFSSLLAGCGSENEIVPQYPEIGVAPALLSFGEVVAGEETLTLPLTLENGGLRTLEGTAEVVGEGAAAFTLSAATYEVAPDERLVLEVTFAPQALGSLPAAVAFLSNDPDGPLGVDLLGVGRVPYAPDIELLPATTAFDAPGSKIVQIRNAGDADLHLGTITQTGAGSFTVGQDWSGATLAPGEARPIQVVWAPTDAEAGESGALAIPSDDADEAEVEARFEANGGGVTDYPAAVIDCPGAVDLPGPVDVVLDGSASTAPDGGPLTYAWSIRRRPPAADPGAAPVPEDQPVTAVTLDAAGTWEIALVVTDAAGLSSPPTKCVIDAIPRDALHVELSWGGATSDLDLHLADASLASGDAAFYAVPADVSYCNPNPEWGGPGDDDDPSLDLDDAEGFGPENINVRSPADGTYPVRVHLFDDGIDGEVTATVSVFAYGEPIFVGSEVLARNEVWDVGEVNWPDGTFAVATGRPWDAGGVRECHE